MATTRALGGGTLSMTLQMPLDHSRPTPATVRFWSGRRSVSFGSRIHGVGSRHVAVTWTRREVTLYVDGRPRETRALATGAPGAQRRVQVASDVSARLTAVELYRRALPIEQVRQTGRDAQLLSRSTSVSAKRRRSRHALAATAGGPENLAPPILWSEAAFEGEWIGLDSIGEWDETADDWTFQWMRCDADGEACVAVADALDSWRELSSEDVGSRLLVRVTALNGDGATDVDSDLSPIVGPARAPIAGEGPWLYGEPWVNSSLYADAWFWGASPMDVTLQWYACELGTCSALDGATDSFIDLTPGMVDKQLYVEAVAVNSIGSATAASERSAPVAYPDYMRPQNVSPPEIFGSATRGETLSAGHGDWVNFIDEATEYRYQWLRCDDGDACQALPGAIEQEYALTGEDVRQTMRVRVEAINEYAATTADSQATPLVEGLVPVNIDRPQLTGVLGDGETLSVTPGDWASEGGPIEYSYEWERCDNGCVLIYGATETTYRLTSDDVGNGIYVRVTATNQDGSASSTTEISAAVEPVALTFTTPPTVGGSAREGATLTSLVGAWSGSTPRTFERTWQRCDANGASCADLAGASGHTYTPQATDVGSTMRLRVMASNAAGAQVAFSEPTAVVEGAAPSVQTLPTVSGSAVEGANLTAHTGQWSGSQPLALALQWQRCDAAGAGCADIGGATETSYRLTAADHGATIRVQVTASNTAGTTLAQSAPSAQVATGLPRAVVRPALTGDPLPGQQLSATTGDWAGTQPIQLSVQWQRCSVGGADCEDLSGATSATYVATAGDAAMSLRVRVLATNPAGEQQAFSSALPITASNAPSVVRAPALVGSPAVGATLTVDPGEWDETAAPVSYRWQRCDAAGVDCHTIPEETGSQYRLTSLDVATRVQVIETASNGAGDASAGSAPSDLIRSRTPVLGFGFDEGRGGIAYDAATGAPAGELTEAVWASGGRHGGAVSFDGNQARVAVAGASAIDAAGQLTAAAWLNPRSGLASAGTVLSKGGEGNAVAWSLTTALDGSVRAHVGNVTLQGPRLAVGRWTHAAVTYDSDIARLFVDREQVATAATADAIDASTEPLLIGSDGSLAGGFRGLVDEVRIYNRALGADELGRARLRPLAPEWAERPLLAYAFDDDEGAVALDSSGFGHPGTIDAAVWTDEGYLGDGAFDFDGTAASVTAPATAMLDIGGAVTLEAAVRPRTSVNEQPILSKEPPAGASSVLWARDADGLLAMQTPAYSLVGPELPLDAWSHVAFVDDGDRGRLFVDGDEVASTASTSVSLTGATRVGAALEAARFLDGSVDDVRVYDRALADSEISDHAQSPVQDEGPWVTPELELSGSLVDHEGEPLTGEDAYDLHIEASEEGDDGAWVPGVTRLEVRVHGDDYAEASQSCPEGGCRLSRTFSFSPADYEDGSHDFEVIATDALGHRSRTSVTMHIEHPHQLNWAPVGLVARVHENTIALEWVAAEGADLVGFKIHRTQQLGSASYNESWLVSEPQGETTFVDSSILQGRNHWYRVVAVDANGNEFSSSTEAIIPGSPPASPSGLLATSEPGAVALTWQPPVGMPPDGYIVYRSTTSGGPYQRVTQQPIDTASYRHHTPAGDAFHYVVRAVRASQLSTASNEVSATAAEPAPPGPGLTVTGSFVEQTDQWLDQGTYELEAIANDLRSVGLDQIEILIDEEQADVTTEGCADPMCALTLSFDVEPATLHDAHHMIEVVATDGDGHTTTKWLDLKVDHGAPEQVQGVTAAAGNSRAVLRWPAAVERDLTGYLVLRASTATGPFEPVTSEPVADYSYVDNTVQNGATYYYIVRAVDQAGNEAPASEAVSVTPGGAAADPPGDLTAAERPFAISLSWSGTQAADLAGFNVYRTNTSLATAKPINEQPVTTTSFTDQDLEPGEQHTYVVRAVNTSGEEGPSSQSVTASASDLVPQSTRDFVYHDWSNPHLEYRYECCYDIGGGWQAPFAVGASTVNWSDANTGQVRPVCSGQCGRSASWAEPMPPPPSLSPDGQKVVWRANREHFTGVIMISNVDGSGQRVVCGVPGGTETECVDDWSSWLGAPQDPIFTPDGQRVLYGGDAIYSIATSGSDRRTLVGPRPNAIFRDPVQSADGRKMYFNVTENGVAVNLWVADADGSNARKLDIQATAARPSPDGSTLVFAYLSSYGGPLYTSDANGRNPKPLHGLDGDNPSWSTDGRSIILQQEIAGDGPYGVVSRIVSVDVASGEQQVLVQPTLEGGALKSYPIAPSYRQAQSPQLDSPDLLGNGAYTDGGGDIQVRVKATDSGSGIATAALAIGPKSTTTDLDCSSGCPHQLDTTLTIAGTQLGEGRHSARIVVANATGTRSVERRTVIVDRTPPEPPADLELVPDEDAGTLTLSWSPGADPRLADGSRGSGVVESRYRVRAPSGEWSTWTIARGQSVALALADVDHSADAIEVINLDRSANASIMQRPPPLPWWGLPVFQPRCYFQAGAPDLRSARGLAGIEVNSIVTISRCSSDVEQLDVRVCVQVKTPGLDFHHLRGPKQGCITKTFEREDFDDDRIEDARVHLKRMCGAGTWPYRTKVEFRLHITDDDDKDSDHESDSATLNCNELNGWKYRAGSTAGSAKLRRALEAKNQPEPAEGFAAHHIIPQRSLRVPELLELGFACEFPPNGRSKADTRLGLKRDVTNGVWLRGHTLHVSEDAFLDLPDHLKLRAYHPGMHSREDLLWVYRQLLHTSIRGDGRCHHAVARKVMGAMTLVFEHMGETRPRDLPNLYPGGQ